MSKYVDVSDHTSFGLGVCARCQRTFPILELISDPNSPGLKVCVDDADEYDPYRLPARKTEKIALSFTRPDEELIVGPEPEEEPLIIPP